MRITRYIWITTILLLAACHTDEPIRKCGSLELLAGMEEGGLSAGTKAGGENADHNTHLTLTSGTKLALRVSGGWANHGTAGTVTQTATATVGAETAAASRHNTLSISPVLYWDDYGTADLDNAAGRAAGLTIYGVAINGKTTAPDVNDWLALSWTLAADQTTGGQNPADKDLLISNNVQTATTVAGKELDTGTYKFDERAYGKLLEFKHALSKITVILTAGDGFSSSLFASDPEVRLTSNNASTSFTEWPYITGYVNVTTGQVAPESHSALTMYQSSSTGHIVTKEALVLPGSAFENDESIIARINADGNIYYVTAEKIRTAISDSHATDGPYSTEAGKNYIIKVTVNKTAIAVTATVTDWTGVTAEAIAPVINISSDFGSGASPSSNSFSFYRSTSLNNGYSSSGKVGSYYAYESTITKYEDNWIMAPQLYWSNHNTHYQFRGVWPQTGTGTGEEAYPRVEDGTGTTSGYQVIKIQNVAYTANSFPSDLQIARPEIDPGIQCTNNEPGHTRTYLYNGGICATEGDINLNFRYMMCQVEVNLSTVDGTGTVLLTGAVVDIINVYSSADVKLGDRGVVPTGSPGAYTLNTVDGDGNENKRWSAIVPQILTWTSAQAAGNVQFRITITNSDSTTDVYYADIKPILQSGSSALVAPNGEWESGVHYVYNLVLSKTKVNVTASLANWTTANANQDVWF